MVDNPNKRKLFNNLVQDGLYTKSYEEFSNKYSTPESQAKLHQGLVKDGLYTKSTKDFSLQYFSDEPSIEKKIQFKKTIRNYLER